MKLDKTTLEEPGFKAIVESNFPKKVQEKMFKKLIKNKKIKGFNYPLLLF